MKPTPRSQTRSQNIVHIIEKPPQPQIAALVDYSVMQKLPPSHTEFLRSMFSCFIFVDFCKLQLQKIEEDIKDLALNNQFEASQIAKLSEDMRLVRRFWIDLQRFAEAQKQ